MYKTSSLLKINNHWDHWELRTDSRKLKIDFQCMWNKSFITVCHMEYIKDT